MCLKQYFLPLRWKLGTLSRSLTAAYGTGGSRSDSSSLWLLVSLNVSAAQSELFRAIACINTVTCMGGLWEMERLQLTIAAPVLSIWKGGRWYFAAVQESTETRRWRDEFWVTDCSLVNSVAYGTCTADLAVKGQSVRFPL